MRKCAPLAVLAAAAFALAVPVAANAAVAGALPANSTLTPDLISARVLTVAANGTTVAFCFNKAIGTTPVGTNFRIRTYRNSPNQAAGISQGASGQCANIRFPTVLDPTTYTTAGVEDNAVINSATGTFSNADSTALIGSVTNNGTRGRSTAPDLTGVSVSGSTVSYTFDEALATRPEGTAFSIQNIDNGPGTGSPGLLTPASVLSADRKTVTVSFGSATLVAAAVRATYNGGGLVVRSESTNDPAPISAAAVPGNTGVTSIPDPIQAILLDGGTGGKMDVVFDQAVTATTGAGFSALLSDSSLVAADVVVEQRTANTIRITIPNLPNTGEYVVGLQVAAVAVAEGNSIGTVPAGGNTGAFATGFTTGPDASAMTFDGATSSATITFDQRYAAAVAGNFRRVDNTGEVPTFDTATLSFAATTTPGPTTIVAQFSSLAGTRALQIAAGGVTTSLVTDPGNGGFVSTPARNTNVDQILAPIGGSAG